MTSTPSNTPTTGRSLDRQITTKDVDCLREAFALFDNERKDEISAMELGKVMHKTWSLPEFPHIVQRFGDAFTVVVIYTNFWIRNLQFWSALATAPAETSAQAKEAFNFT